MTNFSKKFCAKSPFKKKGFPVPAWLQSLIRVAPKSSTKNVTKSNKKDRPYNSDGTPNPNYII
jgi:hypothetical protein